MILSRIEKLKNWRLARRLSSLNSEYKSLIIIAVAVALLPFQNCSKSFEATHTALGSTAAAIGTAPIVTFTSSNSTVMSGSSVTLTWDAIGATTCTASGAWSGTLAASGTQAEMPTVPSTYTITCANLIGSASQSVNIAVTEPAPTVSIAANPSSIMAGSSSTISWASSNATSCTASGAWSGAQNLTGSLMVSPATTSTYTLSCTGAGGTTSQSATITVAAVSLPMVSLTASNTTIVAGSSATLSWNSTNATTCTATGAWSGAEALTGTLQITPTMTSTYNLTCTNASGSATQTVTVTVTPALPTVTISASPSSIVSTSSSVLSWSSTNATSCTASDGWSGSQATTGVISVMPSATTTYSLTCTNAAGTSPVQSVTVTVSPLVPNISFGASPPAITPGASSTLTWTTGNAVSCTASGSWAGAQPTSGTFVVSPTTTSTYTLTCLSKTGGSSSQQLTVTVVPVPLPLVTFTASAVKISLGASSTLVWSAFNATSCTATTTPLDSKFNGSIAISGTLSVSPTATTTYSLSCTGPGGTPPSTNITVTVIPPPTAPTATLAASQTSITAGNSVVLSWSSTDSTACTASSTPAGWSGSIATTGNATVTPIVTTTYSISCTGPGGTATPNAVTVAVTTAATGAPVLAGMLPTQRGLLTFRQRPASLLALILAE